VFTIVEYIQLKLSKKVLILFIECVIYRLCLKIKIFKKFFLNLLTRNVNYSGRTAPLTSKVAFYIFIQQIYIY